jgi:PAS domain S-box-containing protein
MSADSLGAALSNPVFLVYILAFGGAAVACFASVGRARRIESDETRRGLVWLLVLSGVWASAHVAFLVVPTTEIKYGFYLAGLVVGLATVGPWLYFCSAYTGRSLHRQPTLRRLAAGLFLAVVAIKLTNPLHGLYFTAEFATTPFPHLAIKHTIVHWLVMAASYALAVVGYFMFLEMFWQVGHDTTPLVVLIGVTGLPAVFDIAGRLSPRLVDFTYGPLGVAAFAVGLLFVYLGDFQSIRLAGQQDDSTIVLDDEGRVRDYNRSAEEVFRELDVGETIETLVPDLAECVDAPDEEPVITLERRGALRYYQLTTNPFSTDQSRMGAVITLTDITDREQYRRELERQNERLENFASVLSHDLRNPLNVAQARIDLAGEEFDSEHLDSARDALDRMETLITDVLALARQGQSISETTEISLATVAEDAWSVVDTQEATLVGEATLRFEADEERLQQLLENLFRNAIEHGGSDVTVTVGAIDGRGFYVADDGPGIPEEDREDVLESGYTTSQDGTGFGLAIVSEIAEAHGWSVEVTESGAGGARFEITGVTAA